MRLSSRLFPLAVATAGRVAAQGDPPGRVGRLNDLEGQVFFLPAGIGDWVEANRPIVPDDHIWLAERSRAEVHIGSAALRMGANTAVHVLNLDDQTVRLRVSVTQQQRDRLQPQIDRVQRQRQESGRPAFDRPQPQRDRTQPQIDREKRHQRQESARPPFGRPQPQGERPQQPRQREGERPQADRPRKEELSEKKQSK